MKKPKAPRRPVRPRKVAVARPLNKNEGRQSIGGWVHTGSLSVSEALKFLGRKQVSVSVDGIRFTITSGNVCVKKTAKDKAALAKKERAQIARMKERHEKRMARYKEKMKVYNQEYKKYKLDLARYNAFIAEQKVIKAEERLKKAKKELYSSGEF